MSSKLQEALNSLKKDVEESQRSLDNVEALSTGSIAVDMVTGIGGFPRRRITEISGMESSAKTSVCLTAAACAQRSGHFVAYLDTEQGLDRTHAEKIGFDFQNESKGIYLAPESLEKTMQIIEGIVQTDECRLVIVDSVPGMVPKVDLEGKIEEVGQIAHQARLLSAFIPRLAKLINKHDCALVMVNQIRTKINTGWSARFKPTEESTPGGMTLKFYAALRLRTTLVKKGAISKKIKHPLTGKDEDIALGNLHRIDAVKNKVGAPYREAEFYLRYDADGVYGIDNITTVLNLAAHNGLISKKGGGWYEYSGEKGFKVNGEAQLYQYVYEHPDILRTLCQLLNISLESL